jgi:hypothetical protein
MEIPIDQYLKQLPKRIYHYITNPGTGGDALIVAGICQKLE